MMRQPVTCAAPGCQTHIERGKWLCASHWFALPVRLRKALGATWRARHMAAFQENWTEALVLLDQASGLFEAASTRRTSPPPITCEGEKPIAYAAARLL